MQKKVSAALLLVLLFCYFFCFLNPYLFSVPCPGFLRVALFFSFFCRAEQNWLWNLGWCFQRTNEPQVLREKHGEVGRRLAESQNRSRWHVGVQPLTTCTCLEGFCSHQVSVKYTAWPNTGLIIYLIILCLIIHTKDPQKSQSVSCVQSGKTCPVLPWFLVVVQ